jgi:signal transduction histidine kinase
LRRALRTLAHELTVAEARERERIARDLHDEIGQILTVARFAVQQLKGMTAAEQAPHLDEVVDMLTQASRATRSATSASWSLRSMCIVNPRRSLQWLS